MRFYITPQSDYGASCSGELRNNFLHLGFFIVHLMHGTRACLHSEPSERSRKDWHRNHDLRLRRARTWPLSYMRQIFFNNSFHEPFFSTFVIGSDAVNTMLSLSLKSATQYNTTEEWKIIWNVTKYRSRRQ